MTIEVIKPGLLATPQDPGRVGFAHLGIGRAGAFDAPAFRLANALVGNECDACALEITLLGPTLRFHCDARIAVAGAPLPVQIDGAEQPMWSPLFVRFGQTLTFGAMRSGSRTYLAVYGGFDFEPVLSSRSLDVNAAVGPLGRPLRTGDVLLVRQTENAKRETKAHWRIDPRPWFDAESPLRLLPSTHAHLLDAESRQALFSQSFQVGNDSNRVGVRLRGTQLHLAKSLELISEACVAGTLQLPPSGEPIALGVEHPVSGGYPRIGQIAAVDLPRLAQRRPGDALRFAPCTLEQARRALRERERQLREMETLIATRLKHDA
ncbi:MAG TPA: biotin-dependent carboxyltransferase family protein [Rhodanobacteraceae bacterium]|nr:biotin-dependent carboxyltransferase family protein [Rhodanobacteraceae bacterium]